jgi:hypothetical protein
MVPSWTVVVSYLGYAVLLVTGMACWLIALFDTLVYPRVEAKLLEPRWLDLAQLLMRNVTYALWSGLACAAAAFMLAALPAGEAPAVASHKAYQLRYGAIALCFFGLAYLTQGRMGGFDVDIGAVVVFAWSVWIVASGWRAYAGGAAVAGPTGWWLVAAVDGLALVAFGGLMILIKIQGFRMF